jgi:hypothetical protein
MESETNISSAIQRVHEEAVIQRSSKGVIFALPARSLSMCWQRARHLYSLATLLSHHSPHGAEATPATLLAKGCIHSMSQAGAPTARGPVRLLRTAEQRVYVFSQVIASEEIGNCSPDQHTGREGLHRFLPCPAHMHKVGDLTPVL